MDPFPLEVSKISKPTFNTISKSEFHSGSITPSCRVASLTFELKPIPAPRKNLSKWPFSRILERKWCTKGSPESTKAPPSAAITLNF